MARPSPQHPITAWLTALQLYLDGNAPVTIAKATGIKPTTIHARANAEGWVAKRELHLAKLATITPPPAPPPAPSVVRSCPVQASADWLDAEMGECWRLMRALAALDPPDTLPRMIQHAEALSKLSAVARRALRMDVDDASRVVNLRVFDAQPRKPDQVVDAEVVTKELGEPIKYN